MGSGGSKTHESFQVAPASTALMEPPAASADAAADLVDNADMYNVDTEMGSCDHCGDTHTNGDADHCGDCGQCFDHCECASLTSSSVSPTSSSDITGADEPVTDPADEPAVGIPATLDPALLADANAATSGALDAVNGSQLVDWQQNNADTAVTPIPEHLTAGDGYGHSLLIGGEEVKGSSVTVLQYTDANGQPGHQVLTAELTPEADDRIREALAGEADCEKVTVTESFTGRLPADVERNTYDDMLTAAKSVNYHLKQGDELPSHTVERIAKLRGDVDELKASATTEQETAMAAHYETSVGRLEEFRDQWADKQAAYAASDGAADTKMHPNVTAYTATYDKDVDKWVPKNKAGLAATIESSQTVQGTLNADGTSSWDGHQYLTYNSPKSQYRIDMGDGYAAIYRPHEPGPGMNAAPDGVRGQLEIVSPSTGGPPSELVAQMRKLNLSDEPLTQGEAEWSYLKANVFQQHLEKKPAVKKAFADADAVAAAEVENHMAIAATQSSDPGYGTAEWVHTNLMKARTRALRARTSVLRDGVAQAVGLPDGAHLLTQPGYHPIPTSTRTGMRWARFDTTPGAIDTSWESSNSSLIHNVSSSANLPTMLTSGVLASQNKRKKAGVPDTGMSEQADVTKGSSGSVFLRVANGSNKGKVRFEWSKPGSLLSRADWFAVNADVYGKYSHSATKTPEALKSHSQGNNEIMVKGGIDLFGADAPTRIHAGSPTARQQALAACKKRGVTHVNGTPIEKWIV